MWLSSCGGAALRSFQHAVAAEQQQQCTKEEAGFFARRPFAMDIGSVETQYHGVRLRVSFRWTPTSGLSIQCPSAPCEGDTRMVKTSRRLTLSVTSRVDSQCAKLRLTWHEPKLPAVESYLRRCPECRRMTCMTVSELWVERRLIA
jgi:hypothetical protein